MFKLKLKVIFISLLLTAALTMTACNEISSPVDLKLPDSSDTGESLENTSADETEKTEDTEDSAAAESSEAEQTETDEKTEAYEQTSEEETTVSAPEVTVRTEAPASEADTSSSEPLPATAPVPAPKWTETQANGTMYINAEEVFSRNEAVQGSQKVNRYKLNDSVNIVARTDTGYCKLDSGDYIHSSYLNMSKVEVTDAVTAPAVTTTTTAAPVVTTAADTAPAETPSPAADGNYGRREYTQTELDFIEKVFELTNEERAKEGLPAFLHMDTLDVIASVRAWELTVEYRPDHTRPDGRTCTSAFNENGIIYGAWGENIAAGQNTPQSVVEAWMNSPYHRAAILSTEYTYMGAGCYYIENDSQEYHYFWTQEFYCY